jgi:hypothetical protein
MSHPLSVEWILLPGPKTNLILKTNIFKLNQIYIESSNIYYT